MNYQTLASAIKFLLMDADGVLTDGTIWLIPSEGKLVETKGLHSQDNLGLMLLQEAGIDIGIISGRHSAALSEQARQFHINYLYQGHLDKTSAFQEILDKTRLDSKEVAFIGDDFTDVPVMRRAGLGIAVANAREEVKAAAHFVTEASGGQGAVREVAELILKARGLWESVLSKYSLMD